MACRIQNLGSHRLALNLRGGEVLYLDPQETSRPLREESLYDNMYLDDWRQRGLVRRIDAKMSDVLAAEGRAPGSSEESDSAAAGNDGADTPASDATSAKTATKATPKKKGSR